MLTSRVHQLVIGPVAAVGLAVLALTALSPAVDTQLPDRLADRQFWQMSQDFSEPGGTFHSENLVSNEIRFQTIVPALVQAVGPNRAYIGVGSEQNFTYMAAVRPSVAFIVDLRRGNMALHLIYKALFEMSDDRADFVSRVFSRPRPDGLTTASTADEIFSAYARVMPDETLYAANLEAIVTHLTARHGFGLLDWDHDGIEFVYRSWFEAGPNITYQLTGRGGRGNFPTYAALMTAGDDEGRNRSYLASEESFHFIRDMQTRNLVIPVVGNFGGPKALGAVADWLTRNGTTVGAFYTSNVEQYLRRDGLWNTFCASAARLPIDDTSTFIRSERGGMGASVPGGGFRLSLEPIESTIGACVTR